MLHLCTYAFKLKKMMNLLLFCLQTLLKVFAMGKKVLHHKLEVSRLHGVHHCLCRLLTPANSLKHIFSPRDFGNSCSHICCC